MRKIKIYLASHKEPENHGYGRKISISRSKPKGSGLEFLPFCPSLKISNEYIVKKASDPNEAAYYFNNSYANQLDLLKKDVYTQCKQTGLLPKDILPFKDGDTLLSWERFMFSNYRHHVAEFLLEMGYEVILK